MNGTNDSAEAAAPAYVQLMLAFHRLGENAAEEIVAALADSLEPLGASQSVIVEDQAAPKNWSEWIFFFRGDVDREFTEALLAARLSEILDGIPGEAGLRWRWQDLPERDWTEEFRAFFKPFDLPPRYRIAPPWEARGDLPPGTVQILIDPGQGFGTGRHESTRLCLREMAGRIDSASRVFDVGSGSGILSIAAAKLGAARVCGVEIEPAAVRNSLKNLELNGLTGKVEIVEGGPQAFASERFDLVVCNMLIQFSAPLFPLLAMLVEPGGALILSGFLRKESGEASGLFAGLAGRIESRARENDWESLVWRKAK